MGLKICIKELVKHDGIQSDKQRSKMSYGKRVTSPREKGSVIMPEYEEERGKYRCIIEGEKWNALLNGVKKAKVLHPL